MVYTSQDIEDIAEIVTEEYGAGNETELNVVKIANNLGFIVYETDFSDASIAGQVISSNDEKSIYYNRADIAQRQRFTIAHEIGHIVLHHMRDESKPFDMVDYRGRNKTFDSKEWEANLFAANILMPREKTEKVWEKLNDVDDFAKAFNVSRAAAAIRLSDLDLI